MPSTGLNVSAGGNSQEMTNVSDNTNGGEGHIMLPVVFSAVYNFADF